MEAIRTFSQAFNRNLEEPVREHLVYVYGTLALSSLVAAVGAYVHLYVMSAGIMSALAGLGCLFALYSTPHETKNINLRMALFLGFSLSSGHGLGPLIQYSLYLNPSILVTALASTFFIFASFSMSALFAKRGSYLFLGGPLASLLSTMFWLSLANIFFGSSLLFQVNLYAGLILFCGYILYDTTVIIEKRRLGDKDFILHSILLYIDLISVFKRIMIILSQREEEEQRRRRKD